MSNKILTFGEVMMRISPSNNKTLQQSKEVEFFFGGTEMNVAASLSTFGCDVKHITNVSNDFVGDSAISYMKSLGINISQVNKNEHPLGLYFLEVGSAVRPSRIAYNRLNGSFANINPNDIDWNAALQDCEYFHWTGITPGISENAYLALKQGLEIAKEKGINITTDPAYRSNLWNYGKKGQEVLKELVGLSTIFIGGVNEINEILGTQFSSDKDGFIEASKTLLNTTPSIQKVFDKVRIGKDASNQLTKGRAWVDNQYIETTEIEVNQVVDRIGTGDAFAAGLIYGLMHFDYQKALDFSNAACALKHTILGDVNLASVADVLEVVNGNLGGRIKR
ncbi:2-dehydro-3-deoxygluconokinase [Chishuiella changwenlii]|uniref:2-dehydro-3-deoxygluconokinase n=1 Tax=Chishuiella changwenlii TaxID=1434701 RepID=A0A1M7C250_9FLAO|nr:sugar kinase [Chishuiella changwenlii]GGF05816.1 2-dehydro-3-deoxygluconokinase [Chishuiella changwenlii]SHL61358.1 2-dehydro-3-deoxygluconokinase [Chishuiella changwenlii]